MCPYPKRPLISAAKTIADLRRGMLWLAAWICWTGVVWSQEAPTSFPYTAYTLKNQVEVFSGPGTEHYATAKLPQGTLVEVYRHDLHDWCAVRPVPGSFSMVPADVIEVVNDQVGRCKSAGVQVWVGTELGPVEKPLWQIKLKAGEEVTLLGEISYPTEAGFSTLWYQIEPPAGEYRWIKRSDLMVPDTQTQRIAEHSKSPSEIETTGFSQQEPFRRKSKPVTNERRTEILDDPFADEQGALTDADSLSDNQGWRRARVPLRIANQPLPVSAGTRVEAANKLLSPVPPVGANPFPNSSAGSGSPSDLSVAANGPNVAEMQLVPTVGAELLTERLQKLEMDLSAEIVKPAENWNLNALADQLLRVQETAVSPAEQEQARRLLSKLDRLRSTQSNLVQNYVGTRRLPQGGTSVGSGVSQDVKYGTTYDAYGWLSKMTRSNGREEPAYALQDDNGKIICLLEPSPGLNLHRYLNTKVGVMGTRGFNQQLKINHVIADRVVVLDKGQKSLR